jgi:branched-chain amino acid transport system substrate-binding protein
MTRWTTRSRWLVMLCVAALVVAACGSDKKATTSAASSAGGGTTGTTAAKPTGTNIVLGVVYSETGRTGNAYGNSDDVAKAWAQWVNNEQGGVNGHPVEIAAGDSKSTGEGAAAAGREVVESKKAVAVILQDSTTEAALTTYLEGQGVPNIGGSANGRPPDSGTTHWPNLYFNQAPSSPTTSATPLVVSAAAGLKKFGAAVCAEVPVCAEADKLFGALAPKLNLQYVGLVTVGAADPSFTAPCINLVGKGADALDMGLAPSTIHSMIDECEAQGFTGTYVSAYNSVLIPDLKKIKDIRMIGGFNGFPWWASEAPAKQFRDVMAKYAPGVVYEDPASTSTWAALELFRKQMTAKGPAASAPVTSKDIIAAYQQIKDETLGGLLPQPITYTATGPQPLVECFWPFDFDKGEVKALKTTEKSGNGQEGDLKSICYHVG